MVEDTDGSRIAPKIDKARHSTKDTVKIAQRVLRDPKSTEDAKSLAASVLSQADPND